MAEKKTKIVLDADVINHFVRGGQLSLLPKDGINRKDARSRFKTESGESLEDARSVRLGRNLVLK